MRTENQGYSDKGPTGSIEVEKIGRHFTDDVFEFIFLNVNGCTSNILQIPISLKFVTDS